jgi:hypothetical protein
MKAIADSGFIAALFARSAPRQQKWALDLMRKVQLPVPTTILNIFEASALTSNPEGIMRLVVEGDFKLEIDFAEEQEALHALLKKYPERMDLPDAAIVRLSELFPRHKVLTLDKTDFSIYRRFKSEKIPCEFPPD